MSSHTAGTIGTFTAARVFAASYARKLSRSPATLAVAVMQPILFVLLFAFVLGGAIDAPGTDYAQYLVPGVLVQTAAFVAAGSTSAGLSEELRHGVIDRYRTMPVGAIGLLLGRSAIDLVRTAWALAVVIALGLVIGLRFQAGVLHAVVGLMVLILAGVAFSWVCGLLALWIRSAEGASYTVFLLLFPLTFASSVYVDPATMPVGLRTFAELNPISVIADVVREGFGGTPIDASVRTALLWLLGFLAVSVPASIRLLGRARSAATTR